MSTFIKPTRPKRMFYALNVSMHFSFDTLAKIAEKQLGASLDVGDLIICDNKNGDKRKMLQKTKTGYMIYYARLHKKMKLTPLAEHNGQLKSISAPIFS